MQNDNYIPFDEEAEMATIGSMMIESDCIPDVVELIGKDDADAFYMRANRILFEQIIDMHHDNKPIDAVTLRNHLQSKTQLDEVGGINYIIELSESVPSSANVTHYATIVKEKHTLRHFMLAGERIKNITQQPDAESKDLISQAEKELFEVIEKHNPSTATKVFDLCQTVLSELDERMSGQKQSDIKTGYLELDDMLGGLHAGEMIVIAARPSMGKTAFGMNIAEYVSLICRIPVAFYSLEMSGSAVTQRMLCSLSGVSSKRVRSGVITDQEYDALMASSRTLNDAQLHIDDSSNIDTHALISKMRHAVRKEKAKLIIIDYLQLITHAGKHDNRQTEVQKISAALKAAAKHLSVPIIIMAQLNRGSEDKRPSMSNLRESGAIEQDADVVILIHRPGYYTVNKNDPQTEIIVDKQRNGPTGIVKLHWDASSTRFTALPPDNKDSETKDNLLTSAPVESTWHPTTNNKTEAVSHEPKKQDYLFKQDTPF